MKNNKLDSQISGNNTQIPQEGKFISYAHGFAINLAIIILAIISASTFNLIACFSYLFNANKCEQELNVMTISTKTEDIKNDEIKLNNYKNISRKLWNFRKFAILSAFLVELVKVAALITIIMVKFKKIEGTQVIEFFSKYDKLSIHLRHPIVIVSILAVITSIPNFILFKYMKKGIDCHNESTDGFKDKRWINTLIKTTLLSTVVYYLLIIFLFLFDKHTQILFNTISVAWLFNILLQVYTLGTFYSLFKSKKDEAMEMVLNKPIN
ncbi:hypothetical protein GINT2_000992 [Glugoides intestinalis]